MPDFMDRPAYQRHAIIKGQQKRRGELMPLREHLEDVINAVGWRRARPVVEKVLGFPIKSHRGAWWGRIGKRNAAKLEQALNELPHQELLRQERLW